MDYHLIDPVFDENPEQIPGIEPPSTAASAAFDYSTPPPPEIEAEPLARMTWDVNVLEILGRYPMIGVAGSAANARFVLMFRALGGTQVDPVSVAELVMVYPPKERITNRGNE